MLKQSQPQSCTCCLVQIHLPTCCGGSWPQPRDASGFYSLRHFTSSQSEPQFLNASGNSNLGVASIPPESTAPRGSEMATMLLGGNALSQLLMAVLGPHLDHSLTYFPWISPCLSSPVPPLDLSCLTFAELRVFTAKLPTWLCPGEESLLFS